MPDENGTEATQDALNAYESLFGDETPKPAAAVVEEEGATDKASKQQQGSDDPEDQTGGAESGPLEDPASEGEGGPAEDLKVVVSIREGSATIGVQRPSSDPHIESFDDPDLSGLAREVSAVIERARAKWEDSPRYPAYTRPNRSTGRRSRREQGPAQDTTAEEGAAQDQPQTLRLF